MSIRANPWPLLLQSCQPRRHLGNVAGRVGVRQASRGCAHTLQPSGITQQGGDGIGQPYSLQLGFFYHDGRAGPLQRLGVDPLMIIRRARERNKNCRLALPP